MVENTLKAGSQLQSKFSAAHIIIGSALVYTAMVDEVTLSPRIQQYVAELTNGTAHKAAEVKDAG